MLSALAPLQWVLNIKLLNPLGAPIIYSLGTLVFGVVYIFIYITRPIALLTIHIPDKLIIDYYKFQSDNNLIIS